MVGTEGVPCEEVTSSGDRSQAGRQEAAGAHYTSSTMTSTGKLLLSAALCCVPVPMLTLPRSRNPGIGISSSGAAHICTPPFGVGRHTGKLSDVHVARSCRLGTCAEVVFDISSGRDNASVTPIDAVPCFSKLKGFTALSQRLSPYLAGLTSYGAVVTINFPCFQ